MNYKDQFEKLIQDVGSRRFANVLFCDVSNSTEIARKLEPEIFGMLMHLLEKRVRSVVKSHEHQGTFIKSLGDGFLVLFGYPELLEDHALRAINAALAIQSEVQKLRREFAINDIDLKMHMGLHSGICIVTEFEAGAIDIFGNPVNVASKICDFAGPGEIYVSETTLGRCKHKFEVPATQAINIPGHDERIVVCKISGSANINTFSDDVPFYGRDTEIAWLQGFVDGGGQMALVQAPAGLGKSRLIREFSKSQTEQKTAVHMGQCVSRNTDRPFKVIDLIAASILKSEYSLTAREAVQQNRNLPAAVRRFAEISTSGNEGAGFVVGYQVDYSQTFRDMLREIQCNNILIVDDWQWVDDASRSVIEDLERDPECNHKIILGSRERDSVFEEMNAISVLSLGPINDQDVENTVRSVLGNVDPFSVRKIIEYSGGNPLYVEELCHALSEKPAQISELKGGNWLSALINNRFERLPADLAEIVQTGAVIGHYIPEWLMTDMLGEKLDSRKLNALRNLDFIYPSETAGQYRFKHGLTRDVLYERVDLSNRRALHRQVVKKLAARAEKRGEAEPHAQLAYHYSQSGNKKAAIRHGNFAGEAALSVSALDKAQAHFKKTLELSGELGINVKDKLPMINKYGLASVSDPAMHQTELLSVLSKLANSQNDPESIAWTAYWLGNHLYGLGIPKQSVAHLHIAYEHAVQIGEEKLTTQIIANLGQGYASACEYETAYQYLDHAIELKRGKRKGKTRKGGLVYALSCKGFAKGEQGHFEEAEECFLEAVSILKDDYPQIMTSIYAQRACSNLWNGEFEMAHQLAKKGIDLAHGIHARYNYSQCVFIDALLSYKKTGSTKFLNKMIEATHWLWLEGIGQNLSLNFTNIAECFSDLKDWPNARKYVAGALWRSRKGDRLCESQAYCVLAKLSSAGHAANPPNTYLQKAYQSAKDRNSVREHRNTELFETEVLGNYHRSMASH